MARAEPHWLTTSRICIAAGTLALVLAVGLGYKGYRGYSWVTNELDDGLSSFQGVELLAAKQALSKVHVCQGDLNPAMVAFRVTDVEMTGDPLPDGQLPATQFRAKVQAYSIVGIPTRQLAVWTENYRILPRNSRDCRSPDW